jgi:site-specific DNA-methyltransferase (adenine-specific)
MKQIPDKSIDMILCDLPYGITQYKWDIIIPFEPLWKEYKRIIKDNGCIALFSSQPFTSSLVMSNPKMYKYEWIWQKTHPKGHLNAKKMPMRAHENIEIFYKKPPLYNPQMTHGHTRKVAKTNYIKESDGNSCYGRETRNTFYDSTDRFPLDVQIFSNDNQCNKLHPTQKPVALCEYLIRTYTNENDTVLDNCMGSGTTGVACVNTNRNFIGIELDERYFEIARDRIESTQNAIMQSKGVLNGHN